MAQLTELEIQQYKHGAELAQEKQKRRMNTQSGADPARESKIKREKKMANRLESGEGSFPEELQS